MAVNQSRESSHSLRQWVQKNPFAALLGAGLFGLVGGTLFNQAVYQRQVGNELVRLTDACLDSQQSMHRLTTMKPSVDGTQSLLAELRQTERELDAGVQALGGIRNLGFDLAEVRRGIGSAHQTVQRLDEQVEALDFETEQALARTQGPMQRIQQIEILVAQHSTLLPELEANLTTLVEMARLLQQHGGTAIEAEQTVSQLIANQNRLITLLDQVDGSLRAIDSLDAGIVERLNNTRQVIESAEQVASDAARLQETLLDAQTNQHRAERNLQELLGVAELLADSQLNDAQDSVASDSDRIARPARLVVEPLDSDAVGPEGDVPAINASTRIPTQESLEASRNEGVMIEAHSCEEFAPVTPPSASRSKPAVHSAARGTSLSSRRTAR